MYWDTGLLVVAGLLLAWAISTALDLVAFRRRERRRND